MVLREFIRLKYIEVAKLVKPNSKILDVGCNKAEILDYLPQVSYCGLDVNKPVINALRKRGLRAYYADLNTDKIPVKDKFDYIIILDLLEHIVDPEKVLVNLKRLLKPDGKFIISMPNDYHFLNKLRFLTNRELFPTFKPHGHLHIYPISSGRKFLERSGLQVIKTINFPPHKPKAVPMFIKKSLVKFSPSNFSRVVIYEAITAPPFQKM